MHQRLTQGKRDNHSNARLWVTFHLLRANSFTNADSGLESQHMWKCLKSGVLEDHSDEICAVNRGILLLVEDPNS